MAAESTALNSVNNLKKYVERNYNDKKICYMGEDDICEACKKLPKNELKEFTAWLSNHPLHKNNNIILKFLKGLDVERVILKMSVKDIGDSHAIKGVSRINGDMVEFNEDVEIELLTNLACIDNRLYRLVAECYIAGTNGAEKNIDLAERYFQLAGLLTDPECMHVLSQAYSKTQPLKAKFWEDKVMEYWNNFDQLANTRNPTINAVNNNNNNKYTIIKNANGTTRIYEHDDVSRLLTPKHQSSPSHYDDEYDMNNKRYEYDEKIADHMGLSRNKSSHYGSAFQKQASSSSRIQDEIYNAVNNNSSNSNLKPAKLNQADENITILDYLKNMEHHRSSLKTSDPNPKNNLLTQELWPYRDRFNNLMDFYRLVSSYNNEFESIITSRVIKNPSWIGLYVEAHALISTLIIKFRDFHSYFTMYLSLTSMLRDHIKSGRERSKLIEVIKGVQRNLISYYNSTMLAISSRPAVSVLVLYAMTACELNILDEEYEYDDDHSVSTMEDMWFTKMPRLGGLSLGGFTCILTFANEVESTNELQYLIVKAFLKGGIDNDLQNCLNRLHELTLKGCMRAYNLLTDFYEGRYPELMPANFEGLTRLKTHFINTI